MHKNTISHCCHISPEYRLSDTIIPAGLVSKGLHLNGHAVAGFDKTFRRTQSCSRPVHVALLQKASVSEISLLRQVLRYQDFVLLGSVPIPEDICLFIP